MKSFKKNKNHSIELCRFGGINKLIKQKGNYTTKPWNENSSKYEAPERKGFYAFIFPFVTMDLLGGKANGGKTRANEVNNSRTMYKKFEAVGGEIWTHLHPINKESIIAQHGMWYKLKIVDLIDAIALEMKEYNEFAYGNIQMDNENIVGFTMKNALQYVDRTDFEVFVCRDTLIS